MRRPLQDRLNEILERFKATLFWKGPPTQLDPVHVWLKFFVNKNRARYEAGYEAEGTIGNMPALDNYPTGLLNQVSLSKDRMPD